jgi:ubiquinone/menaquinone biosynthesis C-methylase UbiE
MIIGKAYVVLYDLLFISPFLLLITITLQALKEAYRVLKPSGYIELAEVIYQVPCKHNTHFNKLF